MPHNGPVTNQTTPRRRRPLLLVGLLLVSTGVVLLGYVAWQYWGTNVVAADRHREITSDLVESWEDPTVGELSAAEASGRGEPIALVRIPEFGDAFVVPVIEGVRADDLARGLGHYPGTAMPGALGNFAVAGHRVTHGEPFRDLPELEVGDQVLVETVDAVYTYELGSDPEELIVQPDDTWVLDPVPGEGADAPPDRARITLTTCADLFQSPDRMIAFGRLVDTERKPA